MNRDSDIPDISKDILLRLLFESGSEGEVESGDRHLTDRSDLTQPQPNASNRRARDPGSETLNPLGLELECVEYPIGADPITLFNPGDLPAVQTHFEALLKRRLKQEIAHRPPLFPWEKGLQDYPDVVPPESGYASAWLDHLKNLELPADVPDEVMGELLNQCQRVAAQTRQMGLRLISAVEGLFPDQPQTLDYIARLVSRPAYRSAQAQTLARVDYATASPQQQVALAMLAAQGIFEALSLSVSAANPGTSRTWQTAAGPVTVVVTYQAPITLEVRVMLPEAGAAELSGEGATVSADRTALGELVLPLANPQPQTPYTLAVSLSPVGTEPLQFQVVIEESELSL